MPFLFFALAACESADVVFLLDRSSSINNEKHKLILNFTAGLVKRLNIGQDRVHVGAAQFSDNPNPEFYLNNKFNNGQHLINKILNLEYTGGNTFLGKALNFMKGYFTEQHGSRKSAGIPQKLVVLSDGDAHDDVEVEDAAKSVKDMGVEIFFIGVGDVHMLQLLQSTGHPKKVFSATNYLSLENLTQPVADALCKPGDKPEGPTRPPRTTSSPGTPTTTPGELISAIFPYFFYISAILIFLVLLQNIKSLPQVL